MTSSKMFIKFIKILDKLFKVYYNVFRVGKQQIKEAIPLLKEDKKYGNVPRLV